MMSGIPGPIFESWKNTLSNIDDFNNDESLEVLFSIDKLSVYKDRIPRCNNKQDRVQRVLAYLWGKRYKDGKPVLVYLLEKLARQMPEEDASRRTLKSLHDKLAAHFNYTKEITIPFVILAMRNRQAEELIKLAQASSNNKSLETPLALLNHSLERDGLPLCELLKNYGEQRDEWKPYCEPYGIELSIKELIENMVNEGMKNRIIIPDFDSAAELFCGDYQKKMHVKKEINKTGCVVVADAISLFHPDIWNEFIESGIPANERLSMLAISPSLSCFNNRFEDYMHSKTLLPFYEFNEHCNGLHAFNIGNKRSLRRWFKANTMNIWEMFSDEYPLFSNRGIMQENLGKPQRKEEKPF